MKDRIWQLWAFISAFGYLQGLRLFITIILQKFLKKDFNLKNFKMPFGIRLRKNTSDFSIFKQVYLCNEYDLNLNFIPKTIIDCGANIGLTSIFFSWKYNSPLIFCIEPDGSNFNLLVQNTTKYSNIKCLKLGIWDRSAFLKVINPEEGNSAFQLVETSEDNFAAIEAKSLSDLMLDIQVQKIDILKIDIEGSEKEIFTNGYEKWIPQTRIIIVELHDRFKPGASTALFNALSRYNFLVEIKGENLVCYNQDF